MVLVHDFIDDADERPEILPAARAFLRDTFDSRTELDAILARHARNWDMHRLALVDRNILRLAVRELRDGREAPKTVINEALRLAREFSTAESPRFINGVLEAVVRELSRNAGDARNKEKR